MTCMRSRKTNCYQRLREVSCGKQRTEKGEQIAARDREVSCGKQRTEKGEQIVIVKGGLTCD